MDKIKRNLIIISGIVLAYVAAFLAHSFRGNKTIQPYIEANLKQIMELQESKLSIKHFGTPKIEYKNAPSSSAGEYDNETDTIQFTTGVLFTPHNNLEKTITKILTLGFAKNVEATLEHELGHFYADKLNESLGRGNWKKGIKKWSTLTELTPDGYNNLLIGEGIAEYFKIKSSEDTSHSHSYPWPSYRIEYLFRGSLIIYDGGYHLVKPIIDAHGRDGIVHLIINPPTKEDLLKLLEYQKRTLEYLATQSK